MAPSDHSTGLPGRARTLVISACISCVVLGAGVALGAVSDLDPSFDGDGVVRNNLLGTVSANDVAIQSDGKIVSVGVSDIGGTENAVVARTNTNGTPDTASFGGGDGDFEAEYEDDDTTLTGVAVRPTGQIVSSGFTNSGTDLGVISQHTSAGALDTAGFGGGDGLVKPAFNILSDPGSGNRLNDIALATNSDAVAVGNAATLSSSSQRFGIFSVTSAGTPRNPFGGGTAGEAQVDVGSNIGSTGASSANAVAIEGATGDIIVAGEVDPTSADGGANDDLDAAIVRLTSAGTLDTASGFGGGDAIVTVDVPGSAGNSASDVAVQPDGKILIAGDRDTDAAGLDLDHFVMRLNANGTPDTGFGDGGDGIFEQSIVTSDNFGNALVMLPDGRVVVAGHTIAGSDWVVARYTPAGLPDTTFDLDGSRRYDLTPDTGEIQSIARQTDGKLVVAGQVAADLGLGRLEADPLPPAVAPPLATPTPAPAAVAKKKKCKKKKKKRSASAAKKCKKKKKKRK